MTKPLQVTKEAGRVNLRSRCPEVENGKAYYGSVVSVLDRDRIIGLRRVEAMRYQDDVFYWGIISNIFRLSEFCPLLGVKPG